MDEHSENIKMIFTEALEKSSAEEQVAYLKKACGSNSKLRSRVESLLKSHREAGDFFQKPAISPAITLDDAPILESPGTVIGRYKLLEKIGEGGMAVVYIPNKIFSSCGGPDERGQPADNQYPSSILHIPP